MVKVGCVIMAAGPFYELIGNVAARSFLNFHPEVPVFFITDEVLESESVQGWEVCQKYKDRKGILKYALAEKIMTYHNLEKMIILGADTITCGRLDEFLVEDECHAHVTLDYPYPFQSEHFTARDGQPHLNADVVCFNDVALLREIIECSDKYEHFCEQGGLNEVLLDPNYKSKNGNEWALRCVDAPWTKSSYNVRSKCTMDNDFRDEYGNRWVCASATAAEIEPGAPSGSVMDPTWKPWKPFIQSFFVGKNNDGSLGLYTGDWNQIKVFHFCEGWGSPKWSENARWKSLAVWYTDWFNADTLEYFKRECGIEEVVNRIQELSASAISIELPETAEYKEWLLERHGGTTTPCPSPPRGGSHLHPLKPKEEKRVKDTVEVQHMSSKKKPQSSINYSTSSRIKSG